MSSHLWKTTSSLLNSRMKPIPFPVTSLNGQDILKWAGLRLCEHYMGTSYTHGMRVMGDHSTRLYIFKKINEEK